MERIKEIYNYRQMIFRLVRKDLRGRYKGSVLGFFWTFLNPLLQLLVYTMVFSVIMRSGIDKYYLFLFVALVPWIYFSSSLTGGATSILGSGDMVKKIYFPREVMPIAYMTSSFVNMLLSFLVVFAVLIVTGYGVNPVAMLYLPIIMIVEYILGLGIALLTSALTVYLRDLAYILSIIAMAWQFLTPVMYSQEMVLDALASYPTLVRIWNMNPMTPVINAYRDILYYKTTPQLSTLAAAVVLAVTALPLGVFAAKKDEAKLAKVTLNEVAHSIFYAPQYVAIEEGYFKDEGLDMTLITGFGADKTMTAVISGEADIGFMGAEASIYAYQEGATDPVVNFAQLTQRAGNFLVAREEMPDFKWEDLKGRKVLGGRKGGMPEMVFEYILKQNGLDPQKDLSIDQSIDFGATAAAFTGDDSADFTVEFEPSATALEKQGAGYVVASLGVDSGYVPYTSYSAKTSYMEKNPDIMQKFTDALQKGMDYVQSHTPEEIAEVIEPQFPETDLDTITAIVKRYYDQDTWKENLVFGQDGFELLQDILEDAGELKERTPYAELVNTEFAQNAS